MTNGQVGFIATLLGTILGFVWSMLLIAPTENLKEIGTCSQGQNLSLRDTVGTAVYTVHFKDGKAVEFKCTEPDTN
jgi:hypothetical protein